jgi:hypothetical protein
MGRTMLGLASALVWLVLFLLPAFTLAEESYTFNADEVEKKPYFLGGYIEFRPTLYGLDNDAALYKVRFFDRSLGDTLMEYNGKLFLDAGLRKDPFSVFLQTSTDYKDSQVTSQLSTTLYQGYVSFKPSDSFTADGGKRTLKWGKGYAWSPAAFFDRPKDPDDPELALEGFWVGTADYIKSFTTNLKTFSLTPVVLPSYQDVNDDFGETGHVNVGGKAYFLFHDTDIDLMALAGGSRTVRYGFDFSRNVLTNLEVHGEFAWIPHFTKPLLTASGSVAQRTYSAVNYLLGLRFLTAQDTTYILEYYFQGVGYSPDEIRDYFRYVDSAYDAFASGRDARPWTKVQDTLSKSPYNVSTPMRHYLYLRVTQKEPFDILYFTPALTLIYNLQDSSFQVTPELLYAPITNLELRLRAGFLVGGADTEFGEKPFGYRLELRARYYF